MSLRGRRGSAGSLAAGSPRAEPPLTRAVPAEGHGGGGWAGGHPEREEADGHAAHVCQQVGCVRHDGQAVRQVPTCGWHRALAQHSIPLRPILSQSSSSSHCISSHCTPLCPIPFPSHLNSPSHHILFHPIPSHPTMSHSIMSHPILTHYLSSCSILAPHPIMFHLVPSPHPTMSHPVPIQLPIPPHLISPHQILLCFFPFPFHPESPSHHVSSC